MIHFYIELQNSMVQIAFPMYGVEGQDICEQMWGVKVKSHQKPRMREKSTPVR